ncbi:RND family transporter [Mycobacterium sp. CBMA271]|uniref:MMPL/RND family transporter n=1 Tax=Mycobacteroides sp. CBMA 271 TaxID=2606608 RepID=UPI001322053A|nr:RND family transporter [Mycobacteroides sp. CBMA 271]MUM21084.1 RND family transporter [Mycobacteroides sp. CBMA 271]
MHNSAVFGRLAGLISRYAFLVIGAWCLVGACLAAVAPNPQELILTHSRPMMPTDSKSGEAARRIAAAFDESSSNNNSVIIVEKDTRFDDSDRQFRAELLSRLQADKKNVESIFDTWSDPQMSAMAESPDKQLTFLQLQLAGDIGTPQGMESVKALKNILDSANKPAGTHIYATGTSQAIVDQLSAIMQDEVVIGSVSIFLVGALLLLVYRSMFVALLPLLTVGLAFSVATPLVGYLVQADLAPMTMMTTALMAALMLGAGTDYSVFFIGRYQEGRRSGLSIEEAFTASYRGVAPVVIASGLTVAGALLCMNFTQLDMFQAMGTPAALGMVFTVFSAVTVTPSVLLIGARRFGLFEPRRSAASSTFWRRIGIRVARWPKPLFVSSFVLLLLCMLALPTAQYNYDELQFVPQKLPSSAGLAAANRHFPQGQMYPDMVLIESDHDLRNSTDIAILERAAQHLSRLSDVNAVQWLTRPLGTPLDQASLSYGVGYAGTMASQNSVVFSERAGRLHTLTSNLGTMISTIEGLQGQLKAAQQGAQQLNAASVPIQRGLQQLNSGMKDLNAVIAPVRASVSAGRECAPEPVCASTRTALSNFDSLGSLTTGMHQIVRTTTNLSASLAKSADSIPLMVDSLTQMHDMAIETDRMLSQMTTQMDTLTAFMQDFSKSTAGSGEYFYFPARLLSDPQFEPFIHLLFSKDGTKTRMIVMGATSSFDVSGQQRARDLAVAMKAALKGTALAGSVVSIGGPGAMIDDMHTILGRDEQIVAITALTLIFTVVLLLLRSLVASVVVVASVLVSLGSTLGLSLLIWQHLLGTQLHWSIPAAVFAILISVGADYNLLVAARFKEEMGAGIKTGVIRAIAGTGGVVTTAGMVFAMTMFAMMGGSLLNTAQLGSTIGLGLVLDTLVVRTFTVPTLAVILGKTFWWPIKPATLGRRTQVVAPLPHTTCDIRQVQDRQEQPVHA